jgi:hypothetical protein
VGILRTAATVAVASSVHGRVQRRQQARWAAQDQANASVAAAPMPPPPSYAPVASAPPADIDARLAQLAQLGNLMNAGVLTEAEFQQQKAKILGS